MKTRIAIVCQNDTLWSLYAWNKTIPLLLKARQYEIAGFWVCDEKFMNIPSNKVLKWYHTVFGSLNFVLLALFKVVFLFVTSVRSLTSGYKLSFSSLCSRYKIPYYSTPSPNNEVLSKWVKENQVEVLVVMVGHILKGDILHAPTNCIINKHAALLPLNKGVFPYFWAYVKHEPQGISFHKVIREIDGGEILYQEKVEDKKHLASMISFYFYTYKNYGSMLLTALQNAKNNITVLPNAIKPSYHGGPTKEDYTKFKNSGGSIIRFNDLFLPFNI